MIELMLEHSWTSILFWFTFFWLNIYLVFHDYRYKKIRNKYLLYLIGLYIIGAILGIISFSWLVFPWLGITLVGVFSLFYFHIWSAGDAKYVLVASLFLSPGSFLSFIGNIAIITCGYLMFHTIRLYIIKSLFSKNHARALIGKIYTDIRSKLDIFLEDSPENKYHFLHVCRKIFPFIFGFLIFFTALRLFRIYAIEGWIQRGESGGVWSYLIHLMLEYSGIFILIALVSLYILYRLVKNILQYLLVQVSKILGIPEDTGNKVGLYILASILFIFIGYEYYLQPDIISGYLLKIFTLYIFVWICIKILMYIHYVTFQLMEVTYKNINDLNVGDRVDKEFLIGLFATQKCLGYGNKNGKYAPNPRDFFRSIENPIGGNMKQELQYIYKKVNAYHSKEKTIGFEKIEAIKTIHSFAFAPYVFAGLIISLLYEDRIIRSITDTIISYILF